MLLIVTALAQASEPRLSSSTAAPPSELESIDAPASVAGVHLETQWQQPRLARLTAGTIITAGGLVLTLMTVHGASESDMPGDLVPGRAVLPGLSGSALLLGGGALWLSADVSADRIGRPQGFAIRSVW